MDDSAANILLSPIFQYGFAGMSGVLLLILWWLISRLLALLKETNGIIAANTTAILNVGSTTAEVKAMTGDELKLMRIVNERLLARPCIARPSSTEAGSSAEVG
jgi:hypothetical protein